ncbi:hypothetical protein BH11MYX3_BH11MYX3_21680 [soil metagenome]
MFASICSIAGCVQSASESCGDGGGVCPRGRHCAAVAGDVLCVTDEQLAACADKPELTECVDGVCRGGVCLPTGCGNLRLDPGEACDDGNNTSGDLCSADCLSDESCGNGRLDPTTEQCDDGPALATSSHDGCSSQCTVEIPRWDVLPPTNGLFANRVPAAAYDLARQRLVVFGDALGISQTVEWDGRVWDHRSVLASPVARQLPGLAYDAEHGRTLLFGGIGFNDTWELDGAQWTLRSPPSSPPQRGAAAMAYDPKAKRIVLFGGRTGPRGLAPPLDDTWIWDGSTWTTLSASDPHPTRRSGAVIAYDPARNVLVMFGGEQGTTALSDTWELRGRVWSQISSTTQPPARIQHGMAFDPASRRLLMSGGSAPAETWAWDGVDWTRVAAAGSTTACVMATMGREGFVAMVTAEQSSRWTGSDWVPIDGTLTPWFPVASFAGAADVAGRRVVVYGGITTATYVWTGAWTRIASSAPNNPGRLNSNAMAFDAKRREFVMFGGTDGTTDSARTWVFDGSIWTERTPATSPPARADHAMVYDAARERVVLFGGSTATGQRSDTWLWDGTTWTEVVGSSPPPRSAHTMTYDPIAREVLLFGGYNLTELGDTWSWDGTTWQQRTTIGPGARFSSASAWDAARQRAVLFGGSSTSAARYNDVWEWNGTTWAQLPIVTPLPGRNSHVMTTSISGAGVLAFGGDVGSGTPTADVARLQWAGSALDETGVRIDLDGDGSVGCDVPASTNADPDLWAVCSPECPPGDSLPSTCGPLGSGCGDSACDARRESCVTCPEDCGACASVCGDLSCDPSELPSVCPGDC